MAQAARQQQTAVTPPASQRRAFTKRKVRRPLVGGANGSARGSGGAALKKGERAASPSAAGRWGAGGWSLGFGGFARGAWLR
jgi:hypothetical protein